MAEDLLFEHVVLVEVAELVHEVAADDGVARVDLDALGDVFESGVEGGLVRRGYLEVAVVHGEVGFGLFPAQVGDLHEALDLVLLRHAIRIIDCALARLVMG